MELQRLSAAGVGEGQECGVQQHLLSFPTMAVEPVTDDGDAEAEVVGGMEPQLVGSTGERSEFDSGSAAFYCQTSPEGDAHLAVQRVMNLIGPVVGIESEGEVYFTIVPGDDTFEDGNITLADQALLELTTKMAMCFTVDGQHHQPGGVHVESMHRRLSDHAGQQASDLRDHAVLLVLATSRHRQQSTRFVHHDKGRIQVNDAQFTCSIRHEGPPGRRA